MLHKKTTNIFIYLVLLPLVVFSTVPIGALFQNDSASALTIANGVTTKTSDRVMSWWYYQAMIQCIHTSSISQNAGDISGGKWFNQSGSSPAGFYARTTISGIGTDGRTNCDENSSQLSQKALGFWGIKSLDFICAMGASRQTGTDCKLGVNDDFNQINQTRLLFEFDKYIKNTVYKNDSLFAQSTASGLSVDKLSAAEQYTFYTETLLQSCIAGDRNAKDVAQQSTKPSGALVYEVKVMQTVLGVMTPVSKWYIGAKNSSDSVVVYPDGVVGPIGTNTSQIIGYDYNSAQRTLTCKQIMDRGLSNAQAAANNINFQAAKTACEAKGYVTGKLTACILGAQNQTQPVTWCDSQTFVTITSGESKDSLIAACKDGLAISIVKVDDTVSSLCKESACVAAGGSSCVIEGVGWIICPVFNFLAGVADSAYNLVEGFLKTDVGLFNSDSGTYRAWVIMRNFANIGFVVAFLLIIFSQLSNIGITNYGVKKMLPRLIIAAILVNLSYYISQIAVDLSNILGSSVKGVLDNVPIFAGEGTNAFATGTMFSDMTIAVFSGQAAIVGLAGLGAAAYFGGAALLIPILIAAVLAIIVTILILIARQALVILLVVVSPLAFLAMLLPNTENLFKQWRKIFISLLIIYPSIALLFGASKLAAGVLVQSNGADLLGQLMASAVMVLPLFAIPSIVKGSLNAVPVIGNIASKLSSRANSNIGSVAKKRYGESRLSQFQQYRKSEKDKRRALIQSGAYKTDHTDPLSRLRMRSSARNAQINAMTGGFGAKSAAAGVLLAENQDAEELKAASARLRSTKPDRSALRALSTGGSHAGIDASSDHAVRAAAIQSMVASNDVEGMAQLWDRLRTEKGPHADRLRSVFADSLQGSGGRPVYYGQGAISEMRLGTHKQHQETVADAISANAYSPEKIATADKDDLAQVLSVVHSGVVAAGDIINLRTNAQAIDQTPQLSAQVSKNAQQVGDIKTLP